MRSPVAVLALACVALSAAALPHAPGQPQGPTPAGRTAAESDAVLHALEAEVARAMAGFAERTERPPYFLGYQVWDQADDRLTASNGALLADRSGRQRLLDADVRVGGHDFDNTRRFQGRGAPFFGFFGRRPEQLPLGEDEPALRAAIWLRTESEYQSAVERLTQLEANRAATAAPADTSPDFSREDPLVLVEDVRPRPPLDRGEWAERLRRLSARFTERPEIHTSSVTLLSTREVRYLVNSEGTRVRTADDRARLMASAQTRADDGMDLSLFRSFEAATPAGLPAEAAIAAAVDTLIADLTALRTAPPLEPYTGPAIMSGRASAVFFHEIFGHRIEGHRQKDEDFAQTFTGRVGEQVLPRYITVLDDPSRRSHAGIQLSGHYRVDDEGVRTRSVTLVENGVLRGFLMGRSPIRAEPRSNGHGRRQPGFDVVARQGNLIVESSSMVPSEELRRRLIEEVRRSNAPYGLRFEEIQGGFTFTGRVLPQSFKVIPLKVYRVYADGRPDQLVRGLDMVGTPLTVFSRILATDDRSEVFNGICGAESGAVPVSAASPAILFAEVEVEKQAKSMERPPILAPPAARPARAGDSDVLLAALADELARSADSLRLAGLANPYYLAFRAEDAVSLQVEATFGEVAVRERSRQRRLYVEVRVGDRQADNSNYFDPSLTLRGTSFAPLPLDDRYEAIRRQAWWAADQQYKRAAEALARKAGELRGRAEPDTIPDFSEQASHVRLEPAAPLAINDADWIALSRRASAVFRDHPAIEDSRVGVLVRAANRYFLSTEGSRSRVPWRIAAVVLTATARGTSGAPIRDYRLLAVPADGPAAATEAAVGAARELAGDLGARARAPAIESYRGPVLFEGRAAAQFFHALLGRHLSGTPNPVAAAQFSRMATGERRLEPLLGRRVLPSGFRVTDDPTRAQYGGRPLFGHYLVDDEGMPPQPVAAVVDGVLRAFVMSRAPARSSARTTGHARAGGPLEEPRATIGNLIVETDEGLDAAAVRRELVRLAREEGLEYGIAVRTLEDRGILPDEGGFASFVLSDPGGQRPELPAPSAAFRVYPDGREEPIQGAEFAEVTIRALRDIVAAGGEPIVHNFLHAGNPTFDSPLFAVTLPGPGKIRWGWVPAAVVAPAVLVRELELRRATSREKPPVLRHPYFVSRD